MEALKKTAVLLSGLVIIVLVTWILSMSSKKEPEKVTLREKPVPETQEPVGPPEDFKPQNSTPREREKSVQKKFTPQDSISWRTSSRESSW